MVTIDLTVSPPLALVISHDFRFILNTPVTIGLIVTDKIDCLGFGFKFKICLEKM